MTDYVVTAGRSSTYPSSHFGGHYVNGRATYCLDADLATTLDANTAAIPNLPVTILTTSPVVVTDKFFGMHVSARANDALSGITAGTVRSHDIANGKGRWKYIEISDNVWDFTDLDLWVNTHYRAGRDLVFTLFGTPTWASARPTEQGAYGPANLGTQAEPSDMTKWSRFCAKVATRYLGKIKYYEIWNEPNYLNDGVNLPASPGSFYFSGTFAKLSEMTRLANQAIKAVDPTAKIIAPSITVWSATAGQSAENWFVSMMAASDGASGTMKDWIDIVNIHLYLPGTNKVQDLAGMIDRVKAAMVTAGISGKEIWDTESAPIGSTGIVSVLNDNVAKYLIARMLITMAAKGIARTMYYQYDSASMGFKDRGYIVTYREATANLLKSNTILSVSRFTDGRVGVWTTAGLTII